MHKIILTVGTAVVLVLSGVSAHAYHRTNQTRISTEASLRTALHDHDVRATAQIAHLQTVQWKLETECKKFQTAYPSLPLITRNKTVAPDCTIPAGQ